MMFMVMVSFILSTSFYMISKLGYKMFYSNEKLLSFECGFNSFLQPLSPFSIQFFKILLIFLLFDMEIIVILPFCFFSVFLKMNFFMSYLIFMMIFLGLIFEWKEGSLEWLN
uniref:NADH-ubiquinone oxidoreductase chain 3 n=1 Tax=Amblyseiulella paraheveae TaxID=3049516 RepID=A0AAU6PBK7_9ACAR